MEENAKVRVLKHYQVIIGLVQRGQTYTTSHTLQLAGYSADDAAETARTMVSLMYPNHEASFIQSVGKIDGNGLIETCHEVV